MVLHLTLGHIDARVIHGRSLGRLVGRERPPRGLKLVLLSQLIRTVCGTTWMGWGIVEAVA